MEIRKSYLSLYKLILDNIIVFFKFVEVGIIEK